MGLSPGQWIYTGICWEYFHWTFPRISINFVNRIGNKKFPAIGYKKFLDRVMRKSLEWVSRNSSDLVSRNGLREIPQNTCRHFLRIFLWKIPGKFWGFPGKISGNFCGFSAKLLLGISIFHIYRLTENIKDFLFNSFTSCTDRNEPEHIFYIMI